MNNYALTLTIIKNNLSTLSHLLEKAESYVKEGGVSEDILLSARLAPDMYDLKKQIQITTDDARRNLRLLAGKAHIAMEDNEKTLEELRARVQKTKDIVDELTIEDFIGADERHVSFSWMGGKYVLGKDMLEEFVLANFFFHLVTVYDILRKEGVSLGKMDFITKLSIKENV